MYFCFFIALGNVLQLCGVIYFFIYAYNYRLVTVELFNFVDAVWIK